MIQQFVFFILNLKKYYEYKKNLFKVNRIIG